ncbi:lysophospholipid acyltransferase family protein [Sinomicrobium soli]|uniref:lysophospholipid acyltransferase family protein n=1 Tax=Sinomicrobium sp. N-1-3-6 TaxID=2219864 RepID=UPI000DCF5711|nr:lysophospholipid acyltransferase family protein [Sinomicrobium sp. N-1-3-6]RAV27593.1 1-acyl-sn-glycerol-3-phosphate acyltransferase [Sinomicrobium sp. N-1-3-6]
MKKILSYPISALYYLCFGLSLVVFHPIQWICLRFGYEAHKRSVSVLNLFLVRCTNILGTTYRFENIALVPEGVPLIIVSNHQSMYDIPAIIWYMRKFHPKFISKKELGHGIPSVSFNLRHGGSVLIDRKDPKQALPAIKAMAGYIERYKRSAVIFPEGTRSKNGAPKRFSENGLKILCKYAPSAYIVPLSINNSWKLVRNGNFPLTLCNHLTFTVHQPFAIKDVPFKEIFERTENAVKQGIIK